MHIALDDIGGAQLTRGLRIGTSFYPQGRQFTGEEIRGLIRAPNLRGMIGNGLIHVWPKNTAAPAVTPIPEGSELHMVSRGFGNFDVIQGKVLNEAPMTKDEAKTYVEARRGKHQ